MSSSALPGTPRTPAARKTSISGRLEDLPRAGSLGSPRGGSGTPIGGSRASSLRQGSLGVADSGPAVSLEIQAQLAAQAAEAASKAALEEIERDPIFSSFLDDEFNATSFASQVLNSGSAVQSVRKLSDGIGLLERQLRHEVVLRHSELLQQLVSLRDTEAVLAVVRAGADSLQASVQRVRSEIAEPYKQVKTKTRQLAALHDSMELLRAVIKFVRQVKKLREHMSPPGGAQPELAKAAQMWAEIEGLRKEGLVADVAVVDAELAWLHQVGQQMRAEAMKTLEGGMEALNQAEVGSVLQVFYNMGELRSTTDLILTRYKLLLTKSVAAALDMKAISASAGVGALSGGGPGGVVRSGTPGMGAAPRAREALWVRMGACLESVRSVVHATWHLQRVLAKKRDPITHTVFLHQVLQSGESSPCERTWEALVRVLTSHLRASFTASSFVKDTFVSAYPRLLSLVEAMVERVVRETEVRGVAPAIQAEERHQLTAALEPFQSAYLGQSLTRMTDLVNALLPPGATRVPVPPPEAVGRFLAGVEEEVEAVGGQQGLCLLVLKGVNKALLLMAERAEYQVNPSPDARQVSGPATSAEIRNAALCVLLQELWVRVTAILPSGSVPPGHRAPSGATRTAVQLPAGSTEVLESGLAAIHGVASDAVTPLFTAMVERIEACLLLMHDQSFATKAPPGGAEDAPSRYLEETEKALTHFRAEFLSRMATPLPAAAAVATAGAAGEKEPICSALVRRMASRVLLFFVRHASLLRPLSEAGKLRLAREVTEVEFAVSQQLYPVELLGPPYRALRALRPMLFLDTEQMLGSPVLQDLPPSAVLHHLFTRAPAELESPIQRNQLTPARYSLWLDRHSEEDAWKEVKASLEAYARKVKARGDKEFSPIYPLMGEVGRLLVEGGDKGQKGG